MNTIRELWMRKNEDQGRIDITIFFINVFLIMCHVYLMVIYALSKNTFMIVVNIISFLYYIRMFFDCYKNQHLYVGVTFLEIWLHMLLAIANYGGGPCFQNWSFGMIAASFLPAYNSTKKTKTMPFMYTLIVVATYFVSSFILEIAPDAPYAELSPTLTWALYVYNNSVSLFTLIMFALFYTTNSQRKVFNLTRKADYDELTTLYNRYAVNEIVSRLSKDAIENKLPYNLAILDIDHFKRVNDQYGHNSGDIILKEVAKILKLYSTENIIPARWGGEEFVLLAPSSIMYKEFANVMRKINTRISKTKFFADSGREIKVTVSIGVAQIDGKLPLEKAIKIADDRLYEAKNAGRNKVIS